MKKITIWPIVFVLLFVPFFLKDSHWLHVAIGSFFGFLVFMVVLVLSSALAFGVGIVFAFLVGKTIPKQWTESEAIVLVNLRNNSGTKLFLRTINNSISKYLFLEKIGEETRLWKIETDNVKVFELDRQDGELRISTRQFTNPLFQWIALDWPQNKRYEFFIPLNSFKG